MKAQATVECKKNTTTKKRSKKQKKIKVFENLGFFGESNARLPQPWMDLQIKD